jgi:hypothetical protein
MAKLPKGILGPISGKIGNVVGASCHGVAYVRSAPKKKKKKKKKMKSRAQLANEARFKFVNRWMVPFHPFILLGFQNLPVEKPAISTAFGLNYRQAVIGSYPDFEIDFSKVVLSVGDLPGLDRPVIGFKAANEVELTWEKSNDQLASFDDQLMLVLYSAELELADGFMGGTKRVSGKCIYEFDEQLTGKVLDVFVSVTSRDRKRIAESVYLGRIIP